MCVCVHAGGSVRYERAETGVETDGEVLARHIGQVLENLPGPAAAIGIAVPGLVEGGKVIMSDVLPRIAGWSPADSIQAGCPIVVLNDAEAALIEATADMEARATAAVVMVGTGIGCAMLLDGAIFRGARGWAGELGSMPMVSNGHTGPLDAVAGGAALLRALGGNAEAAHARLAAGDPAAHAAVARAGEALGLGLATLINLLNPSRLVLAGGTLRYHGYTEAALQAARRFALPLLGGACAIELAAEGETLVARGAARCAEAAVNVGVESASPRA